MFSVTPIMAQDFDGDGVVDAVDLDDDNDGILDADETPCTTASSASFNASTEAWQDANLAITSGNIYRFNLTSSSIPSSPVTASGGPFDGEQFYPVAFGANRFTDYNGYEYTIAGSVATFTATSAAPFAPINIGFANLLPADYSTRLVFIGMIDTNGNGQYDSGAGDVIVDNIFDMSQGLSGGTQFVATTSGNLHIVYTDGAYLDNSGDLTFDVEICDPNFSTDADGIPDRLDLDSDNDGCPDYVEGDLVFTIANSGVAQGGTLSDGNGDGVTTNLGNTVETVDPLLLGVPIVSPAAVAVTQGIGASQDATVSTACCAISNVVLANQTACNVGSDTFIADVTVTFSDGPVTGTLDIEGDISESVDVTTITSPHPSCDIFAADIGTAPGACQNIGDSDVAANRDDLDDDNDGILDSQEALGFDPFDGDPACNFTSADFDDQLGAQTIPDPAGGSATIPNPAGGGFILETDVNTDPTGLIGDVYRFYSVIEIDGLDLDAIITITDASPNIVGNIPGETTNFIIDDDSTGDAAAFQPNYVVPAGQRSSMDFNIQFVLPNTSPNVVVSLSRFAGVFQDIDGANANEAVTISNPGLYAVDAATLHILIIMM